LNLRGSILIAVFLLTGGITGCGHDRIYSPQELASVSVSLARTTGSGTIMGSSEPVYSVRVLGTGSVEYQGVQGVAARGSRLANVSPQTVEALLLAMDRARFMSIDDHTFQQLTDMPYVVVSLTENGVTKQVRSPAAFGTEPSRWRRWKWEIFATKGMRDQDRFLKLADEIGSLIGTDRWTKCNSRCMWLVSRPRLVEWRDEHGATILLRSLESQKGIPSGFVSPNDGSDLDPGTMIEAGVDVNASDDQGLTPLMAAAGKGDIDLVRDLLAHGARLDAKDKKGRTAFDQATVPQIRVLLSAATKNASSS